jgi:hypothetical protein
METVPPRIDVPDESWYLDLPETPDEYTSAITMRRTDGSTVWEALPPDGERDAWASVSVGPQIAVGPSWSGWVVHYELATGAETERRFTK